MENADILKERYLRQVKLDNVGQEGQDKLAKAKVLVIGIGGLGSPVCMYLAAAGIGRIGLLDYDTIEYGNLQRQIIHTTSDVNKSKVASAQNKIKDINPNIQVDTYFNRITHENAQELIHNYDFVIDATDNFATKFLVNEACVATNTPFSHAGVLQWRGQTMTIVPHKSACFACVFDDNYSKEMNEMFHTGPFGFTPGVIGTLQAAQAIKYFLGVGHLLTNTLLVYDSLNASFEKVLLEKNPKCAVCGEAVESDVVENLGSVESLESNLDSTLDSGSLDTPLDSIESALDSNNEILDSNSLDSNVLDSEVALENALETESLESDSSDLDSLESNLESALHSMESSESSPDDINLDSNDTSDLDLNFDIDQNTESKMS